jgi:hypothetical protein
MKIRQAAALLAQVLLAICTLTALSGSLRAEEEGTAAQRAACTPDVFRFCAMQIPNHTAIANCLEHNSYRLSKKCKLVIEGKLK